MPDCASNMPVCVCWWMSMGGNLALHVAKKNEDVSGLILMSTPYKMRYEKLGILMAHMTQWIFIQKEILSARHSGTAKYYAAYLVSKISDQQRI